MKSGVVDSQGYLDRVDIAGRVVNILGWAGSFRAGPVTGFRCTVSGRQAQLLQCDLALPSPDVKAVFPHMDCSDSCRFNLRLALPEGIDGDRANVPVVLQPQFEHGVGERLLYLLARTIPDPPVRFVDYIGGGDGWSASLEFLEYFVGHGRMRATDRVLDVGCGYGRMACGLLGYLSASGSYAGFDIERAMLDWASSEIGGRYPNFRFQYAPIYNSKYNPTGSVDPEQYVFPYADASFDFAFLTSVFTHMPGGQVRHYMDEVRRVLRAGGRALISCFLLNGESSGLIAAGESRLGLSHPYGDGRVMDLAYPDAAVGYDEALFRGWLQVRRLMVEETHYGSWCGRRDFLSYQDVLIIQA